MARFGRDTLRLLSVVHLVVLGLLMEKNYLLCSPRDLDHNRMRNLQRNLQHNQICPPGPSRFTWHFNRLPYTTQWQAGGKREKMREIRSRRS
jgi:hypothetical protein